MQIQPHTTSHDDLHATKRQFTRWRASHLAGTRIPDHLWDAAVKLANVHGLSRTARTLGLDYSSLRGRVARAPSRRPTPDHGERLARAESTDSRPEFVEFSIGDLTSTRTCVVEIVGATDLKLRLDLKGYPASELDTILRMAWDTARCSS